MEEYLDMEAVSTMVTAYTPRIFGALITLFVGFWLAGFLTRLARDGMTNRKMDITIVPFISSLINVAVKVVVLLSAASMFGIQTTSFVAIASAMVFAIGLALQGSLGHFASGVLLLTFRPYKVGDMVNISGSQGVVKEIQIFNTIIATPDNRRIIIPNGVVTGGVITNITGQDEMRIFTTFGIGYGDDIDKARAVILTVAKECPLILHEKGVDIFVSELGESSVNFTVRPWANSDNYWPVIFYLNEHVKKAFDREGISIPFPQMDVHTHKVN